MNIAIIERLASAGRLDRIFIGGKWVRPAGQDRNAVIDPSTEEPVTETALGNARDVAVAVAEARRAFTTWALSSPHSRAALLDGVHGLILERTESFAQAISQEMGCAISVASPTGADRRRARARGSRPRVRTTDANTVSKAWRNTSRPKPSSDTWMARRPVFLQGVNEYPQFKETTTMTVALLLHRADGAPPSTSFRKAAFGTADPFAPNREIAWEGPASMSAGRVGFNGELDATPFPHTETIVVVDGALTLVAAGAAPLVLGRGDGAVIARGTAVRILAGSRTVFVFCAAAAEGPSNPGIKRLRADAAFKPSTPPPAETLLGPVPQCRSDNVFTDERAQYRAGTWDSTPYHRVVRPHRLNEFMYLLAGGVRFARPDGRVLSADAGDALFVAQGAPIGWESSERVAKFYVVQDVRA